MGWCGDGTGFAPGSPTPDPSLPGRGGESDAHRFANFRPASARCPRSMCHLRRRVSRSTSFPPRPRSPSSTATSAATAPSPSSPLRTNICPSRGDNGRRAMAWPCGVGRPSPSSASSAIDRARASCTAASVGGSSQRSARGSATPQIAQSSVSADRSASRISGGSKRGSPAVAASSHSRYATPGICRAARPARCVTAAWLARSVTSRVIPAARS